VPGELLSAAELRVPELLPSDFSYREIAERLYLSLNTVRTPLGSTAWRHPSTG
jgi:DNA-binding CsgD family transcriptional regulator